MEVVGFTRVRHKVHPVLLCSLHRALEVDGFIRCRWVHSRAPWGSLGLSRVVGFTRTPRGSLGISVVVEFSPCVSLGSSGNFRFARLCTGGLWVYPGSLGSQWGSLCSSVARLTFARLLGVVGLITGRLFHSCAPWVSVRSSGAVWFTLVCPWCRLVHPG